MERAFILALVVIAGVCLFAYLFVILDGWSHRDRRDR